MSLYKTLNKTLIYSTGKSDRHNCRLPGTYKGKENNGFGAIYFFFVYSCCGSIVHGSQLLISNGLSKFFFQIL